MKPKRVAILGSTGSIGRQALEVIASQEALSVCGLSAGGNWPLLAEQARATEPELLALAEQAGCEPLAAAVGPAVGVLTGPDAMAELVRRTRPDVVLSGVVGSAGLNAALEAIEVGSALAIANKETLVMAGAIVIPRARAAGVPILPVDSEHSAIFQCLAAGRREEVRRVVLTASGGALRDMDDQAAHQATIDEAMAHPTWSMGPKITTDSATLVNKALEVVEAHWLFDLSVDQIEVVLHPQSIIHSYVEFCDGSVIAQMGRPDMTTPIAYALCHPDRPERQVPPLDLGALGELTFARPTGRFARGVELGFEAIRRGGLSGAVLNSANEAAVAAFLDGQLAFGEIVPMVENIMNLAPQTGEVTLDALRQADAWARQQVARAVGDGPAAESRTRRGP